MFLSVQEVASPLASLPPAPSQPPGNVVWNSTGTSVLLNWECVRAAENESEVTGYKVSLWGAGGGVRTPGGHVETCLLATTALY